MRIVLLLGALVGLFAAPIVRADNIDTKPLDVLGALGAQYWPQSLMRFRLAGQSYFGDRAPHFTGQMAWVPTYQHDSKVSLGLHLGFGPLPRVHGLCRWRTFGFLGSL